MIRINRSVRPLPTPDLNFNVPGFSKLCLSNGVIVYFVKKEDLPLTRINLCLFSGSKHDPKGKKGLSNLTTMMIDEGAGDYDAFELSDQFDLLGSSFSIRGYNDMIYLTLQSLNENLDQSLELFKMILLNPHFNTEEFERERRKVLVRILQMKDDPEDIADSFFEKALFGESNPYAHPVIGLENDISSLTIEDVKQFYSKHFNPDNAAFIVVGDLSEDLLMYKLNKLTQGWSGNGVSNYEILCPLQLNEKEIIVIHKEGAVQSEIRVGHLSTPRSKDDYFQKKLLNTVLGGQFSSRINLNLREDKGYTYGAFSRFIFFRQCCYFYVSTSVSDENTTNAVKEIYHELEKIRLGVHPEELAFAQSSLMRKFPGSFETYGQIASNLKGLLIHNLPDNYFDIYLDSIRNITLNDIDSAAQSLIHPEQLKIVIVGNQKKILEELKDFAQKIDFPISTMA
jgi:zinc protease